MVVLSFQPRFNFFTGRSFTPNCMTESEKENVRKRFWTKVNFTDECWTWTASTHKTPPSQYHKGHFPYGRIGIGKKVIKAHRVAYELCNGPIPAGMFVLHKCDNPKCVRPSHLKLGNHTQNMQDMADRHRVPRGVDHQFSKLDDEKVVQIRKLKQKGFKQRSISIIVNICESQVCEIVKGRAWKHVK